MKEVLSFVTQNRTLRKLTLSKCTDNNILRATGRLIEIKGVPYLALETFYADGKVQQKNIPASEVSETITQLIPEQYKQMNIATTNGDCEVKVSKKGKVIDLILPVVVLIICCVIGMIYSGGFFSGK